jgi:hypothetical protein
MERAHAGRRELPGSRVRMVTSTGKSEIRGQEEKLQRDYHLWVAAARTLYSVHLDSRGHNQVEARSFARFLRPDILYTWADNSPFNSIPCLYKDLNVVQLRAELPRSTSSTPDFAITHGLRLISTQHGTWLLRRITVIPGGQNARPS